MPLSEVCGIALGISAPFSPIRELSVVQEETPVEPAWVLN